MSAILAIYYFHDKILIGIYHDVKDAEEEMFLFGLAKMKLRNFEIMPMPFVIHDDCMIIMN